MPVMWPQFLRLSGVLWGRSACFRAHSRQLGSRLFLASVSRVRCLRSTCLPACGSGCCFIVPLRVKTLHLALSLRARVCSDCHPELDVPWPPGNQPVFQARLGCLLPQGVLLPFLRGRHRDPAPGGAGGGWVSATETPT